MPRRPAGRKGKSPNSAVFAADDGATWTMVNTTPDGARRVVAAGLEWQEPEREEIDPET
ncbi:MAG: hypothetical protein IMF08_00420 [Proteobacteria bacterium]|nr:hypothetical protein [Pseudomonadota bacterium]